MQFPNKLYSYKDSTLALMPVVLAELKVSPLPVPVLFKKVQHTLTDITDFLSVMDCLYALRAVDLDEQGEMFICLQ